MWQPRAVRLPPRAIRRAPPAPLSAGTTGTCRGSAVRLEGGSTVSQKVKKKRTGHTLSPFLSHALVIQRPSITPLEHVHAPCEPTELAAQPRELVASAPLGLAGRHGLLRRGRRRRRASSRGDGAGHDGLGERWRHGVADGA